MSFFWSSKEEDPVPEPVRLYHPSDEEKEEMEAIRAILTEKRDEYVEEGHEEYIFTDMKILRYAHPLPLPYPYSSRSV